MSLNEGRHPFSGTSHHGNNKRRTQASAKSIARVRRDARQANGSINARRSYQQQQPLQTNISPTTTVIQSAFATNDLGLNPILDEEVETMDPTHVDRYKVTIETADVDDVQLTRTTCDEDIIITEEATTPQPEPLSLLEHQQQQQSMDEITLDVKQLNAKQVYLTSDDKEAPVVRMAVEYDEAQGRYCLIHETLIVLDPINSPTPQWVVFRSIPILTADIVKEMTQSMSSRSSTSSETPR